MSALHAFLANLVDYAGLFPPASLPLYEAIRNQAAYQRHADAWRLGRFICPATQLAALVPYQELFTAERPLTISALGPKTSEKFLDEMHATLAHLHAFHQAWGALGKVEALELTLPAPLANEGTLAAIAAALTFPLSVFYELPFDENWSAYLPNFLAALAAHNVQAAQPVGFKLRTGGVVASAFPSTAQVAAALTECRAHGLALKCTAGLHHPVRHFNASVQTKMHGFINVFGAGMLAHAHQLSASGVQAILEDEAASDFEFTASTFSWCGLSIAAEEITHLRQTTLLSFGSCSFDEPREDLHALGWY
ncbi:MAG: hypothetical protein JNL09_03900 [Anaerolineales bacterium]|nr:hypothetical protein [Anaerolineales bacterium]